MSGFRFQIERLDVEERVLDRQNEQVSSQYTRTALIPQRQLLRDGRVLINAALNLQRTVDQAILGQFPELTEPVLKSDYEDISVQEISQHILLRSIEVDVLIPEAEEKSDLIDGAIGELSPFHHTYGYYAQGIDSTTALLPEGWRERLIIVCNENTNHIRGHCAEIHDLIISKLYAGRQKDNEFFHAAIKLQLITREILLERLDVTPIPEERQTIIRNDIERGFSK